MEQQISLTDAEIRVMIEAVSVWGCEISETRHAIHENNINSILLKLGKSLSK